MAFDLFQSRRNFNERCKWWSVKEANDDDEEYNKDELVHNRVPDGMFYAKEVNAETDNDNIIGGVIMVNRTAVTIQSPDDLDNIKSEDIVEYQGEKWRVENVQKRKARIQNSEFASYKSVSHYWYLSLIK